MTATGLWAIIVGRAAGADGRADRLRERCGGVVTVAGDEVRTRLEALLTGLGQVPGEAVAVALVDEDDAEAAEPGDIAELAARLDAGGAGAVVRARPVVDALKRADGDRVVGGLDRSGLYAPATPQVIRLASLREALDATEGGEPAEDADPAVLLARRGVPVELAPA